MRRHARARKASAPDGAVPVLLEQADVSLLDVIDHVLNQGIVISGEVTIGVADVDLIYVQLRALICSADRAQGAGAAFRPFLTDLGEV